MVDHLFPQQRHESQIHPDLQNVSDITDISVKQIVTNNIAKMGQKFGGKLAK